MKIKVALYFLLAVLYGLPVLGVTPEVTGAQQPAENAVLDLRKESFSDELNLDGQ